MPRTHPTWTHRQAHLTDPRPYPVTDLARAMGLDPNDPRLTSQLVTRLGFERSHVRRYRRIGLTARAADHWATRADLHPDNVWPDWMGNTDDPPTGPDDPPLHRVRPITPAQLARLRRGAA